MIIVQVVLKFNSSPCRQLSLQAKPVQTQSHCSFVTKGSDAILFSRLPEWRGWCWQLSSGSVLLCSRAGNISASLSGLWWETSNMHKWEKGKKKIITDSIPISFTLWSGANWSLASDPYEHLSTIHGKSQICTNSEKKSNTVINKWVFGILNQPWKQCGFPPVEN